NYLFGQTTYSQTARYCPQPPEEDDDDDPPSGDPSWYDGEDDDDDEEHYCWCCFWGSCYPGCGCGCACDIGEGDDEPDEPVDPEPEDYDEASTNYPHMSGILKIRDPLEYTAPIHLTVPLEHRNCCPCPDHATNWVSVVYKSNRLKVVDAATDMDFHSSGESLDVKIAGVSPSFDVGDAGVSFAANGDVCLECAYTVLGIGIDGGYQYGIGDVDLKMLNQRKAEFGLPIPVNTNLWEASELKLQTKVRLPFGNIHLGFEDSTAPFAVWIYDNRVGGFLKLASSTDGPLDISFAGWRQLVSGSSDSYSPTTWIYITAEGAGKATLVYRYWGVSGSAIVEDEARQVITAVNPSLMADYNRDGAIDDDDVEMFKTGRHMRFWTNKDIWKGDDAFPSPGLLPPVLTPNFSDASVNGRNDLVNLCPIKVDLSAFTAAWGTDDFEYVFYAGGSGSTGFALVDVDWDDVRAMVVDDVRTIDGDDLHGVTLRRNERDGWRETGYVLPTDFLDLAGRGSGVIAVEFGQESTSHPLELAVRLKGSNTELFRFTIRLDVYDVADLFRWVNLAGVCGDGGSVSDYPNQTPYIDLPDSDKEVVFVHGYNMAPHEAREWAQAMFKRLWWMGMNANFTAVTWRGNETQTWVPSVGYVTPNYYQNVFNAFKTAPHLAQVVNALPGAHKYVIAHSLGNMLVSAAIQDYGMSYDKCFMLNAAVAMEAFDSNGGVTTESHANMTPTAWLPYADRVRSTHWHELFPQGDGRRELTWKGRFADVHDIVNFFSTEEEVVNNGDS
ncbi:MAG: alpha/beta hydrolase, partial [bacterium]|nr:alpha/beta hydrolase [Candidatus Colisoma equi]